MTEVELRSNFTADTYELIVKYEDGSVKIQPIDPMAELVSIWRIWRDGWVLSSRLRRICEVSKRMVPNRVVKKFEAVGFFVRAFALAR